MLSLKCYLLLIVTILIYFIIYYYYKKKNIKMSLSNCIQNIRTWIKGSICRVVFYKYLIYPILITICLLITYMCYRSNYVLLYEPSSSIGTVYSFVWTVVMVFSIDVAINQYVRAQIPTKVNVYLGIKSFSFLSNGYRKIHRALRSITFDFFLGSFIIIPLFAFDRSDESIELFLWQTSYIVILCVLFLLLISDFNIFHYMHMITNHDDKDRIISYIKYTSSKRLRHDIKKSNKGKSLNDFLVSLIINIRKFKRSHYMKNVSTFELMYLASTKDFNYKFYSNTRHIVSINDVYLITNEFLKLYRRCLEYLIIHPINYKFKTAAKEVYLYKCKIIKGYIKFIDELLYKTHLNIIKPDNIYLFPYMIINKKYIYKDDTWKLLNGLFKKETFIKKNNVNLYEFSYQSSGYGNKILEIIQNNAKILVNYELSYLYHQYRHGGMSRDVYNSLRNVFPKFLKGYITSNEFLNYAKKRFNEGKPIANKQFLDQLLV